MSNRSYSNMQLHTILAAIAMATLGCQPVEPDPSPEQPPAQSYILAADLLPAPEADPVRKLDILFVIDDSESMAEEQAFLAARATEALFDTIATITGARPSLHIAVVSTNMGVGDNPIVACQGGGDGGVFQVPAITDTCPAIDGRFLTDAGDGTDGTVSNYEGELRDAFACMVSLGIEGCGFEQPLEAMRRALDGSNPENAGFLRDDALLAVVFLTDEDDCSAFDDGLFDLTVTGLDSPLGQPDSFRCFDFGVTCDQPENREPGVKTGCRPAKDSSYLHDVDQYVEFLHTLKGDPGKVVVAGIFGDPEPVEVSLETHEILGQHYQLGASCESPAGKAQPAVRLAAFLDAFPARSHAASICDGDLSEPLAGAAWQMAGALERSPCLHGNIADTDASAPGLQADCRLEASRTDGSPVALASCGVAAAGATCFDIVEDPSACAYTETGLAVDLAQVPALDEQSRVQVSCVAE